MLIVSKVTGSFPFKVILTAFRWVFMLMSTPVTVPWHTVPFFSSMVTVSWDSFMRNRTNFMVSVSSAKIF